MIKRIVVILLLLSISLTFCVNASADAGDVIEYNATKFWKWLTFQESILDYDLGEWWEALLKDTAFDPNNKEQAEQMYQDYVDTIYTDVSMNGLHRWEAVIRHDGIQGIRYYLNATSASVKYGGTIDETVSYLADKSYIEGVYGSRQNYENSCVYIYYSDSLNEEGEVRNNYPSPFNGDYQYGYYVSGINFRTTNFGIPSYANGALAKGTMPTNKPLPLFIYSEQNEHPFGINVEVYIDYYKTVGNIETDIPTINIDSRPTIFNGPVIYYNGDNVTIIEQKMIDEVSKFVHLPWLGVDVGFTSWSYDYESRIYSFEIPEDDYLTMEFADEYISYIYNYADGSTATYKAYYAVPDDYDDDGGGDDGGGGGDGKPSFWEKLFETIFLGLIEGIVDLFTTLIEFVANIFNSALGAIVSAFSGLWSIISGFLSGIGSSLSSFFGMFSADGGIFDVPLTDGVPVEIPTDSTSAPLQIGSFLALLGGMIGALPAELIYIGTAVIGITILFGVFKIITR